MDSLGHYKIKSMKDNQTMTTDNNVSNIQDKKSETPYKAILDAQQQTLDVIDEAVSFLNNILLTDASRKVTMRDIVSHLIKNGYIINEAKAVAQYNYLILDLAKARKNKYITAEQINLRIAYIQDRLKSTFRAELHDQILEMIRTNSMLFAWNTNYINLQTKHESESSNETVEE